MLTMARVIRMRLLALSVVLWITYLLSITLNRAFNIRTHGGDGIRMQMDLPQLETTRSGSLLANIGEHAHASDLRSKDGVLVEESRSLQTGVGDEGGETNNGELLQVEEPFESTLRLS